MINYIKAFIIMLKAHWKQRDKGNHLYIFHPIRVSKKCKSKSAKLVAQWLSDNIGGSIYLCPRVELPKNIKTPDYIWDNEKWDLKDINKHSKNTINTAINNTKKQSNNVILNLIDTTYTDKDLTIEMKRIYSNSRYNYINKIIVLQGLVLRKVYKRA